MTVFDTLKQRNKQVQQQPQADQQEIQPIQPPEQKQIMPGQVTPEALRHTARIGSRIVESALGFPGDVLNAINTGAGKATGAILTGAEKLTGTKFPTARKYIEEKNKPKFPGSTHLQQKSEELFGEYTKPQTKGEQEFDEFAQDVTSLALPGNSKFQAGSRLGRWVGDPRLQRLIKSIGVAGVGYGAKKGAELTGIKEGGQVASKIGAMTLASAFNPGAARRFVSDTYKARDATYKAGQMASARGMRQELEALKKDILSGGKTTGKNNVVTYIDSLLDNIQPQRTPYGTFEMIPAKSLTDAAAAINENRADLFRQHLVGGGRKNKPPLGMERYNDVAKINNARIKEFGKSNPEFLRLHEMGNSGYEALANSEHATRFVVDQVKPLLKHPVSKIPTALFGLGLGAPTYLGLKSYEVMNRIARNPNLRYFYTHAMADALRENAASVARNIERFNEVWEKQEKRNKIDISKYK